MRHTLKARLDTAAFAMGSAMLDRAVLALNHLLSSEPSASGRLMPHAGRVVIVDADPLPGWWPWRDPVQLRITRAGLVERADALPDATPRNVAGEPMQVSPSAPGVSAAAESPGAWPLRVTVVLQAPLEMGRAALRGQRPTLRIDGDAAFAADLQWLAANLRWEAADDIERFFGPSAAAAATAAYHATRTGLSRAADALGSVVGRRASGESAGSADPTSGRRP